MLSGATELTPTADMITAEYPDAHLPRAAPGRRSIPQDPETGPIAHQGRG
ncbi:hypothetical protein YT1_3931 [Rhodococcus ruber]|nr:hypothetical protein YT1_3931 [Rhodococcus ruber]